MSGQTISRWTIIILISVTLSCSKDDDPKLDIETEQTEVSFIDVNTCYAGGGVYYTEFNFVIRYTTSSPDIEIEKIHYSLGVGSDVAEDDDYTFDDDGSQLSFSLCIKFGGTPALEYTATLISTEGHESNSRKVKIDRPAGAN